MRCGTGCRRLGLRMRGRRKRRQRRHRIVDSVAVPQLYPSCLLPGATADQQRWLKLKVNRKLQLPRNARLVRFRKHGNGRAVWTEELVQRDDIRVIENIKRLSDEVQLSVLSDLEEFQNTQIAFHLSGSREGVPFKTERTRRQRNCAAAVSIEAGQRIDGPPAPN